MRLHLSPKHFRLFVNLSRSRELETDDGKAGDGIWHMTNMLQCARWNECLRCIGSGPFLRLSQTHKSFSRRLLSSASWMRAVVYCILSLPQHSSRHRARLQMESSIPKREEALNRERKFIKWWRLMMEHCSMQSQLSVIQEHDLNEDLLEAEGWMERIGALQVHRLFLIVL